MRQVQQAAKETSRGGRLTRGEFNTWGRETEAHLRKTDPTAVIPRAQVATERLGPWPTVLKCCGLITEKERRRRHSGGVHRHRHTDLASALRAALEELGPQASRGQYTKWRLTRIDAGDNWPSASWLANELGSGSWEEANRIVQSRGTAALARRR